MIKEIVVFDKCDGFFGVDIVVFVREVVMFVFWVVLESIGVFEILVEVELEGIEWKMDFVRVIVEYFVYVV